MNEEQTTFQKRSKKLVIATDNFLPRWDGISRFLTEVVPKMVHNYEVNILAPMFDKSLIGFPHATTVRFPTFNFEVGDFPPVKPPFFKIRKYIKDADIVWIQSLGPIGALSAYYARKYNKKLVAYVHSVEWELVANAMGKNMFSRSILRNLVLRFARYIYGKCDMLMMPSKEIVDLYKKAKIHRPMTIIKLGTNVQKFIPPITREKAKIAIGIEPHKKVIGFVGRIAREKDIPTLYRAFTQLKRRREDCVLLIVGDGLKDVMNTLSKRKDIITTGAKDNVIPYLQAMDIYVLPSLTETTSLSTIEAMACGCVCITTKVGRIPEYIQSGKNGIFFSAGNSFLLRKKLEKVLDDEVLQETLGKNARTSVVEKFSWESTIHGIETVIDSL